MKNAITLKKKFEKIACKQGIKSWEDEIGADKFTE